MPGEKTVTCRFCKCDTTPKKLRRHWSDICDQIPPMQNGYRPCSSCQSIKANDAFSNKVGNIDGLMNDCKECSLARYHQWRKENVGIDRRDYSRIKTRPGRWKLKPCRYCGKQYTFEGMFLHVRSCDKHPRTHGRSGELKPVDPSLPDMESVLEKSTNTTSFFKQKHRNLLMSYGISIEDYNRMLSEQGGVCAICKLPPGGKRKSRTIHLAVDHCHTTGKVRALLCSHCNVGIGGLKENRRLLLAALDYIYAHSVSDSHVSQ